MVQHRYQHTGHNLHDLVHESLAGNPFLSSRHLQFEVRGENVVLRGVVGSYYQKQLAQESVRAIDGIRTVRNEIEVISATDQRADNFGESDEPGIRSTWRTHHPG